MSVTGTIGTASTNWPGFPSSNYAAESINAEGSGGSISITGTFSPSDGAVGTLTIATGTGSTSFNPGTFQVDLSNAPSADELINNTNTLGLSGANLVISAASTSHTGQTFTIVSSPNGLSGSFNGMPDGTIFAAANGRVYLISYTGTTVTLTDKGLATPPTITSAATTTFIEGTGGTFTVTTTQGNPTTTTITESGPLPTGVTFTDNGDGTATLAGTPPNTGTFTLTITAGNGVMPNAMQTFTLTVDAPPTITSAATTSFTVGTAGSFTVTTTPGFPTATTITESGVLPGSVTFTDNGNGTATLAGTPTQGGTFTLTITTSNGVLPNAVQTFTLSVHATPPPTDPTFFAVGADAGGGPQVNVYSAATNALVASFDAFTPSFTGGVRVAVDNMNGSEDIICAAGPGGGPQVTIYNGTLIANGTPASSAIVASFYAFAPNFSGGVYVAAGTSSSGQNWIAAGAGAGGGPQVVLWTTKAILTGAATGTAPTLLTSFYAFAPSFTGGVTVAVGDVNGDGNLDVIAGAGPGGGPQVVVVNGTDFSQIQSNGTFSGSALLASFYAFNPSFTGGAFVSGGVTSGTQFNLIVGAGPGGGPQVIVVDGSDGGQVANNGEIASSALLDSFYALSSGFTGGVRVGFSATYGSSAAPAILSGAGAGGSPQVAPFSGATFAALTNFFALPQGFSGGLFIAG